MKKLIIASAIAMSGFIYNTANAQIGIRVGFHFGPRRVYAPAPVVVEQAPVYEQAQPVYNDNSDDYYYLPDVDAYYDVNDQCYVYFDGENWISAAYLPGEYRDYDWRNARRYEVRAPRPYLHDDFYRSRFNGSAPHDWRNRDDHGRFDGQFANREQFHNDDRLAPGNGRFDRHFDESSQRGNDRNFDDQQRRGFGQPEQPYRNERGDQQFNNHDQRGFSGPAQPNRNEGGDQQFNNHDQRGFSGPAQPNRNEGGNQQFNNQGQRGLEQQPVQPNRGGNTNQHSDNRGQGNVSQPSNQGGNNHAAGEHFAGNYPGAGNSDRRMGR